MDNQGKVLVEEKGQIRETTNEDVEKLRQNPDKLVTKKLNEDGQEINKVQERLLG